VRRIKELREEDEAGGADKNERTRLRVAVDAGGCSGFQYNFEFDTDINDDDKVFERDGAEIVVDEISLGFLAGSTVDYKEEMISSAFQISANPNAESGCGCGSSFSAKS